MRRQNCQTIPDIPLHVIQDIAEQEKKPARFIVESIQNGTIVVMNRNNRSIGIGKGLRTKINVNLGTSSGRCIPEDEIRKAMIAEKYGADTITDLSAAGDIPDIRRSIQEATSLPLTTVPIYQAAAEHTLDFLTDDLIIENLKDQAREEIASMVIHCPSLETIRFMKPKSRIMGVVSKGGAIISAYMIKNGVDNPYLTYFDEVLQIMKKNHIVLSLGNTMRSGCIHDTPDNAQIMEIEDNIRLAHKAHEEGVQVIIEGSGGHIRADLIAESIRHYKTRVDFPLFVAGPLPADIGMGYDHITGAIGGTYAAGAGADYLCSITRAEHKGLPTPDEIREGLIAFRIAAHIGDGIKYGVSDKDKKLAEQRAKMNFKEQVTLSIDPDEAGRGIVYDVPCTMCGSLCALKIMNQYVQNQE